MIISYFPMGGEATGQKGLPEFTYSGDYELIEDGEAGWRLRFLTSGTFKLLSETMTADLFLVGGGGGGGGGSSYSASKCGGGGGGSGYTTTALNVEIKAGTDYVITIGAGGAGGAYNQWGTQGVGGTGGVTSGFGYSANGGTGGGSLANNCPGGNGGSGGAAGGYGQDGVSAGAAGGSNGSSGSVPTKYYDMTLGKAGTGQTNNTCEFGEDGTTLYAGGGGSGASTSATNYGFGFGGDGGGGNGGGNNGSTYYTPVAGATNTGSGGGGGCGGYEAVRTSGAYGGSGILIMRNVRG